MEMSPNRQNFAPYKEIRVGKSNDGVKIYTGSSEIAVSAHTQGKSI